MSHVITRIHHSPRTKSFPYTTLFRSQQKEQVNIDDIALHCAWPQSKLAIVLLEMGMKGVLLALPGKVSKTDRKSTRLNSSHVKSSYAVFCLKKKKTEAATAAWRSCGS